MIITKLENSTINEVAKLALKLWPDNSMEGLMEDFEQLVNEENDTVYLAKIDNMYVGFIHMSLRHDYVEGSSSSPVGYIEGIYVEKQYRNKGISKKLVTTGEDWLKSLGCTQIASDTELENKDSQEFHKKIGFREANRIVAFIKDLH